MARVAGTFLVGLDYGSLSARGILLDAASGEVLATHVHSYRHAIMEEALPSGRALPPGFALQDAADYLEAAEAILRTIATGRHVAGIGIGFTASSPLPAHADGRPLSATHPDEPHAYVKLWKHRAGQAFVDRINEAGGTSFAGFGGRVSAEWLLAKAAELAGEAPALWQESARFIEAGDWLVWQLTGREARSLSFAGFKAQWQRQAGYPDHLVPGLAERLRPPHAIGSAAGELTAGWRARTGVEGPAVVAVAVIDSHIVMPAVGGDAPGTLVGALGTSAPFLIQSSPPQPLPPGLEGTVEDGMLPGLTAYEAGQAAFGDLLGWFVRKMPKGTSEAESFAFYNEAAGQLRPGQSGLLALDWWNGCRVPYGDARLSGLILGLTLRTDAVHIYRALLESLAFGARTIRDQLEAGGVTVQRIVLTSGLARVNPELMRLIASTMGQPVLVPDIDQATAIAAAIHGAVAGGAVADFAAGAARYGAKNFIRHEPDEADQAGLDALYTTYRSLSALPALRDAMHMLAATR